MKFLLVASISALALAAGACGRSPVPYGDANSIVLMARPELWEAVRDTISQALEPPIFTVREERTFDVTHVSPADSAASTFLMWRNLLLVGETTDSWMKSVIERIEEVPATLPAFVEMGEVWARGQRVTAVLLPPGDGPRALTSILGELHDYVDGRFRAYVRERMFASGINDGLRQDLTLNAGFSLVVPNVYRHGSEDSVYIFRNDQRREGDLVRSVLVTWRSGAAEPLPPEEALAWRDSLSVRYYEPQVTDREQVRVHDLENGAGYHVQGMWTTPPGEWPGAGPFMSRVVRCPSQDRTYLLDAWLYAPGKSKYEYVLQLETILDSFACS